MPLPSGGYLIIEHTEAMHVIDVNSGNRKGADGQESNALATNIEAAEEIARVLQLRDMGGIICVDFIDMHEKANNRALFDKMKVFMKPDRAKHNIVPIAPEVGDKFDPELHQAMFEAPMPTVKAGHILQVLDEGFMISDRLLRPANVGVSSGG